MDVGDDQIHIREELSLALYYHTGHNHHPPSLDEAFGQVRLSREIQRIITDSIGEVIICLSFVSKTQQISVSQFIQWPDNQLFNLVLRMIRYLCMIILFRRSFLSPFTPYIWQFFFQVRPIIPIFYQGNWLENLRLLHTAMYWPTMEDVLVRYVLSRTNQMPELSNTFK